MDKWTRVSDKYLYNQPKHVFEKMLSNSFLALVVFSSSQIIYKIIASPKANCSYHFLVSSQMIALLILHTLKKASWWSNLRSNKLSFIKIKEQLKSETTISCIKFRFVPIQMLSLILA